MRDVFAAEMSTVRRRPGAAGVCVFVDEPALDRFMQYIDLMNASGRVSHEVMRLFCVNPTREATRALCATLQQDESLQGLEALDRLRPNNSLRDLTAPWRLTPEFAQRFYLLVSLETVAEELRDKYPHPNLTLQAGKIEDGESPLEAAVRELHEEARIKARVVHGPPIPLMSKGMFMYSVFVMQDTPLFLSDSGTLYIGFDEPDTTTDSESRGETEGGDSELSD